MTSATGHGKHRGIGLIWGPDLGRMWASRGGAGRALRNREGQLDTPTRGQVLTARRWMHRAERGEWPGAAPKSVSAQDPSF